MSIISDVVQILKSAFDFNYSFFLLLFSIKIIFFNLTAAQRSAQTVSSEIFVYQKVGWKIWEIGDDLSVSRDVIKIPFLENFDQIPDSKIFH